MDRDDSLVGRLAAAAGGAALAASVFLTWYALNLGDLLHEVTNQLPAGVSARALSTLQSAVSVTITSSGWNAVHVVRFALLLVGLVALTTAVAPGMIDRRTGGRLLLVGGLIAAGLAAYRIASPPASIGISFGPFRVQTPAEVGDLIGGALRIGAGPWVALVGGGLTMLGGWSQLGRVATPAVDRPLPYPVGPASKAPPSI